MDGVDDGSSSNRAVRRRDTVLSDLQASGNLDIVNGCRVWICMGQACLRSPFRQFAIETSQGYLSFRLTGIQNP